MIQVAMTMIPELVKLITSVVEDPDTYKKLEALRQMLEKLTGKEIDKNGLITLLEGVTQGEEYTGKWERLTTETRRLRVANGYIYDMGRGNPIYVQDK